MPGLDGQQAETKNVSSAPKQRLLCGQIRAAVAQTNPNSMPHNQRLSPLAFRLIYGLENTRMVDSCPRPTVPVDETTPDGRVGSIGLECVNTDPFGRGRFETCPYTWARRVLHLQIPME